MAVRSSIEKKRKLAKSYQTRWVGVNRGRQGKQSEWSISVLAGVALIIEEVGCVPFDRFTRSVVDWSRVVGGGFESHRFGICVPAAG